MTSALAVMSVSSRAPTPAVVAESAGPDLLTAARLEALSSVQQAVWTTYLDTPNLERAVRLKNNASRGGVLEHIHMRDVTVGQMTDAIVSIDFTYEEGAKGAFR